MRHNACLNACLYTIQICCSCEEPGNPKLFLTCLGGKKCWWYFTPFTHRNRVQPAHKGEECLLCPVVFQLSSLTAAPTSLVLLYSVWRLQLSGKGKALPLWFTPPTLLSSAERPAMVDIRVSAWNITLPSDNPTKNTVFESNGRNWNINNSQVMYFFPIEGEYFFQGLEYVRS